MNRVRLKGVRLDVDFRKNEATNYDMFKRSKIFPGELHKNEVFLFISKSGNQLVWVLNVDQIETAFANKRGNFERRIVDTRRWRIEGGTWNPHLLQNYANDCGLDLVGFKRFEDRYYESRA